MRAADLAIGNLESILLERGTRADTTNSPVFAGPQRESLPLLLDAGFDAVGTANNHAWDFGHAGLIENLRWLDSAGLPHAGTGPTVRDAWRPAILRRNGWTVALFSITAMFNYPDLTVIGHAAECCVAWLDTTVAAANFRFARDSLGADVVIAFVHQGLVEYRGVPDDASVIFMRALARRGADAVIGHHPHVPQGVEWMGNVPIVYSLGNFVFMQRQRWTDRGLWAELVLTPGAYRPQLTVLPLVVGYTPSFATGADSLRVMRHVDSLSARLSSLPNPPRRRNVSRPRTP